MKTTIISLARKLRLTALMGCTLFAANFAHAQVAPVVTPVVAPVVTPVVTTGVNTAFVSPVIVNPVVNPVITTPMVAPVIANIDPIVMPDVNPDVNVDVDVNIVGPNMNQGKWFATIKGDKIRIEFRADSNDEYHGWSNNSDFKLSDFPSLPRGQKGEFSLKREAGTIVFNGVFDDDMGFGSYKFTPNNEFVDYIKSTGVTDVNDRSAFNFFMADLK